MKFVLKQILKKRIRDYLGTTVFPKFLSSGNPVTYQPLISHLIYDGLWIYLSGHLILYKAVDKNELSFLSPGVGDSELSYISDL